MGSWYHAGTRRRRSRLNDADESRRRREVKTRIAAVEAILRRWDPIGIQPGAGGPLDEYDSYAPGIVALVDRGITAEELQRHLSALSAERMGVGARPAEDRRIAEEILAAAERPARG